MRLMLQSVLALAAALIVFVPAAGRAAANDSSDMFKEVSVTWTSQEDFESGGSPGSGPTLRRNIDTTTAPGDIRLRRTASSWEAAAPREKLFDIGRLGSGLALAANGANGEYLAAWGEIAVSGTAILVQRISAAGTPVGTAQRISAGGHYRGAPRLALNAETGQFLAVYLVIQGAPRLVGRLLKADGTPVGSEVTMADCFSGSIDHDLLWVPKSREFLLVWHDQVGRDSDLFARHIGADCKPKGKAYLVSGRPGNQARPRLAFRRARNDLVVVFEEELQGRNLVLARRLDAQGSPAGEEFVVAGGGERGGRLPAVVCPPGDDAILFAWDDLRWQEQYVSGRVQRHPDPDRRVLSRAIDLYGLAMSGDGPVGTGAFLLAGGRYNQTLISAAAEPERNQILAVWQDGRHGYENWDVYAAALESDGSLAGEEFSLDAETGVQLLPVVVHNKRNREFLAAWEDAGPPPGNPAVYSRRIAALPGARGSIEGLRADSGSPQTVWRSLSWDATLPEGTALRVRTRTAEEQGDLAWANWSEPLASSGSAVRSSAGRWIEVRVELESRDGKAAPLLHEVGALFATRPSAER